MTNSVVDLGSDHGFVPFTRGALRAVPAPEPLADGSQDSSHCVHRVHLQDIERQMEYKSRQSVTEMSHLTELTEAVPHDLPPGQQRLP